MPAAAYDILSIFVAFGGFLVSFYLTTKKREQKAFVCPLKAKCHEVIHSEYASFMGVNVEWIGMAYFGLIALMYAGRLLFPILHAPGVLFGLIIVTMLAALFSIYLFYIQLVLLRQWCSWCLLTEALSIGLFILTMVIADAHVTFLFASFRRIIETIHAFAFALGVGGATITAYFFFRFLKNFKISVKEAEMLRALSQVTWTALALLIVSGLGLMLPYSSVYISRPAYIIEIIVILAILVLETLMSLTISPKLVRISFGKKHEHKPGELKKLRLLAFGLGAAAIASWYFAFVLNAFQDVQLSLTAFAAIYAAILGIAVLWSRWVEYRYTKRAEFA